MNELKELLSKTQDDVHSFCIFDRQNEVFVRVLASTNDVDYEDVKDCEDDDPEHYRNWDVIGWWYEDVKEIAESQAPTVVPHEGALKIAHDSDTMLKVICDCIGFVIEDVPETEEELLERFVFINKRVK